MERKVNPVGSSWTLWVLFGNPNGEEKRRRSFAEHIVFVIYHAKFIDMGKLKGYSNVNFDRTPR